MSAADEQPPFLWRALSQWPTVILISLVILIGTTNPILTSLLPYLKAAWPAMRTAFWLRSADPWRARGTVGFLFHLCTGLFRAAAVAVLFIVSTMLFAVLLPRQPNVSPSLVAPMIAMGAILLSCFVSTICGWSGIVIAIRHQLRIYVVSDLIRRCRGDFNQARQIEPVHNRVNPAKFIICLAIATPALFLWFMAMLIANPSGTDENVGVLSALLLGLPVLCLACLASIVWISGRVAADSPAQCWGAKVPDDELFISGWHQAAD